MVSNLMQRLFPLEPQYRERIWGGQRLKAADPPVGEAWVAYEECRVLSGDQAGRTVAELASAFGARFLGREVAETFGTRFPLLVKLLDCADWLSVQVHPDDEQAGRFVGPGECGKTEAWHFLEVEEGATVYAGVRPGTSKRELEEAIRGGRVLEVAQRLRVRAGETVYIPSGTLHALGPGLLLYELQQSSDTTFRVYDWGRPASAGRRLHIKESVAVADPDKGAVVYPPPSLEGTASARTLSCHCFDLDVVRLGGPVFEGDTEGRSFHILTTAEGSAEVSSGVESMRLGPRETALIAGGTGPYRMRAVGGASKLLRASVPPAGRREAPPRT